MRPTFPLLPRQPRQPIGRIFDDAARMTVAAGASLMAAKLCRLPESYWAAITAIIIISQVGMSSAVHISIQRLIGTALGAAIAATAATYFPVNSLSFAIALFITNVICHLLRLDIAAKRFAGITLAIVFLIPPASEHWTIAFYRFVEVSVGIAAALATGALWTRFERSSKTR